MTNETMVTLQGNLGADVVLRRAGEAPVAHLRVACTPRRLNRATGEWSDGTTQWYSVSAWRGLAQHCAESLRRGDPVIVHGRLNARTYVNKEGVEVTSYEVDALTVGHDLNRGVSHFTRRGAAQQTTDTRTPAAPAEEGAAVAA